jgi:mono/diheme cytochrome c family protein
MNWRSLILAVLVASIPAPSWAQDSNDLAKQAKQIFTTYCYRCHGQNGAAEGSFNAVLDLPTLGGKVRPGDPAKSRAYKRMSAETMPPEDEKPRPKATEIATIEKWIKAGAPVPKEETLKPRLFVSLGDELSALQRFLRKANREDRHYLRFFTLRHLHNLPPEKVRDADLRSYRAALSKLINSLSRKKDIVVPDKADEAGTLYAVDIRKLDWDTKDLWGEILKVYPYGLKHDQYPNVRATRDLAEEVYELAGTKIPVLRADWFITTAARPPLYYTLLQLPTHARQLERELGVHVAQNFRTAKLSRAGFNGSGISGNNRLVERHASDAGAYWKSYDFKSSTGRGNLFVFPLGPEFPENPYPRNAFRHDGGEIIFNLPNGLQGYFLVDGKDNRIDAGPIEVVSDVKKISGTPLIVSGLSCMACHQHGMIPLKDQIREGHILGGAARDLVSRLYPEATEMNRLVQKDKQRFLIALEESIGPFVQTGEEAKESIEDFPEPISAIARWYLLQEMTLEEAARELGLKEAKVLQGAIEANPRLQELGLYPLAKGNAIKREVWENTAFAFSPFQEAARELKLGLPQR